MSNVSELLSLDGEVALVTGASGGIGRAIALRLAQAGASMVLQYQNNQPVVEQLASEINQFGKAICVAADLNNPESISSLHHQAIDEFSRVSVLVNCAASQSIDDLINMDLESWRDMQSKNVDAVFLLSQLFSRQVFTADATGKVVNISSIEGSRPAPGHGHYATSKAALEMLTRATALEFAAQNVRVNALAPGLIWRQDIETQWPEGVASWNKAAPLARLGQPQDIANAVLFLSSPASSFITGTVLTVDGGMSIQPGW